VGGGALDKPKLPTSRWAGPRILAAQPYPSVLASASLSIARCVSLAPSLYIYLRIPLLSIQLSFQPVCELKRPRRNRTAGGELINLSLPHRPAINRSSSCLIHKHSHPSRPAAGFQKTPDAIIRTPPVQFLRSPSTSKFAVFQNTPGQFRGGVNKPSFQLRSVSKHPGHNRGRGEGALINPSFQLHDGPVLAS
jgi:hypothetical protein